MKKSHCQGTLVIIILCAGLLIPPLCPSASASTFYDNDRRYSIWYPDSWERTSVEGADAAFLDTEIDNFRENINVLGVYENGVRNTREYVIDACNEGIAELRKIDPTMTIVSGPNAGMIRGHWSATYVFDMEQHGQMMRFSQTIIVSQGYSYAFIVTCTSLPHTFDDYQSTFTSSINSFEVLNEPDIGPFSGGLVFAVAMGALLGGVSGGVIFYFVQSKRKKEDQAKTARPPVKSTVIKPAGVENLPPMKVKMVRPGHTDPDITPPPPPNSED